MDCMKNETYSNFIPVCTGDGARTSNGEDDGSVDNDQRNLSVRIHSSHSSPTLRISKEGKLKVRSVSMRTGSYSSIRNQVKGKEL